MANKNTKSAADQAADNKAEKAAAEKAAAEKAAAEKAAAEKAAAEKAAAEKATVKNAAIEKRNAAAAPKEKLVFELNGQKYGFRNDTPKTLSVDGKAYTLAELMKDEDAMESLIVGHNFYITRIS